MTMHLSESFANNETLSPELEAMKDASIRRIKGPSILLGSGNYFDFLDPEGSEITLEDIAYGLAYNCRFAGQTYSTVLDCRIQYSVAEHCVRGSLQAEAEQKHDLAREFLVHELGEAVAGDMTGPLKSLCPDYKQIEKHCQAGIAKSFGLTFTDFNALKLLDLRMLATERRDVTRWSGEEWSWTNGAEPFQERIIPWDPDVAAKRFIARFHELWSGHAHS